MTDSPRPEGRGTERIAKVISRAGRASRRAAEKMVEDGLVTVNGETIFHPGHPVRPRKDVITVDGERLAEPPPRQYFVAFKPRGLLTTREDPQGRPTVQKLVEHLPFRLEPVGRLDMDTEGVLLFTNDGELAHGLTHPSNQVPRRYLAKVWKRPDAKKMARIKRGIKLDDGFTGPCKVRVVEETDTGNCWIEITVTEGRNRLIRRLFEAIGHPVSKLRRESFGTVSLRGLERGQVRALSGEEVDRLYDIVEGKDPRKAGQGGKYRKGFAKPKPKPNKPLSKKKRARAVARKGGQR
jgi:23S rRNA pseudouridine2605 synthase